VAVVLCVLHNYRNISNGVLVLVSLVPKCHRNEATGTITEPHALGPRQHAETESDTNKVVLNDSGRTQYCPLSLSLSVCTVCAMSAACGVG
jgi:hypothetical protein